MEGGKGNRPLAIATDRQHGYLVEMTARDTSDSPPDAELRQLIESHLNHSDARIAQLNHRGQFIWVKQPERYGRAVLRLQKGDPQKAFERERAALHQLGDIGVPVPEIVAEGPEYFAISDCGSSLNLVLSEANLPMDERTHIFGRAGVALADLHMRGLSHGRPSLRDICWNGSRISFIDFERFDWKRPAPKGPAQDVVMLLLNAFSMTLERRPEIDAVIAGYRENDTQNVWAEAQRLGRRLRWVNWLTRPVQMKRRGAREFKAIPLTFAALKAG